MRTTCEAGTCVYTQVPESNPLARQDCGLSVPWSEDFVDPAPGTAAYFLTTGVDSIGVESDLGAMRPNDNPCP